MSVRALALDWSLDGPVGTALLVLVLAAGVAYFAAAARGRARDRRHRRWPRERSASFVAGLGVLVFDVYSGLGTRADSRLSIHMVQHMVLWVVVAPLLAAAAPVRLAFFALPRSGRRRLARWLRSRPAATLTRPSAAVLMFSGVLLLSHVPAIYGLALRNDYVHEAEHGLYLLTAVLLWASMLGVDPIPHRTSARRGIACLAACMLPMALIALWLQTAHHPVYGHYLATLGPSALGDQRLAASIMWTGALPACLVPALMRLRVPDRRLAQPRLTARGT
jgi:putative membrane protein